MFRSSSRLYHSSVRRHFHGQVTKGMRDRTRACCGCGYQHIYIYYIYPINSLIYTPMIVVSDIYWILLMYPWMIHDDSMMFNVSLMWGTQTTIDHHRPPVPPGPSRARRWAPGNLCRGMASEACRDGQAGAWSHGETWHTHSNVKDWGPNWSLSWTYGVEPQDTVFITIDKKEHIFLGCICNKL